MRPRTQNVSRRIRRVLRGAGWLSTDEVMQRTGLPRDPATQGLAYLVSLGEVAQAGGKSRSYRWAADPEPETRPPESHRDQVETLLRLHPGGLTTTQAHAKLPHLTLQQVSRALTGLRVYGRAVRSPPDSRRTPWFIPENAP